MLSKSQDGILGLANDLRNTEICKKVIIGVKSRGAPRFKTLFFHLSREHGLALNTNYKLIIVTLIPPPYFNLS